jgi:hypothetical protein
MNNISFQPINVPKQKPIRMLSVQDVKVQQKVVASRPAEKKAVPQLVKPKHPWSYVWAFGYKQRKPGTTYQPAGYK